MFDQYPGHDLGTRRQDPGHDLGTRRQDPGHDLGKILVLG